MMAAGLFSMGFIVGMLTAALLMAAVVVLTKS